MNGSLPAQIILGGRQRSALTPTRSEMEWLSLFSRHQIVLLHGQAQASRKGRSLNIEFVLIDDYSRLSVLILQLCCFNGTCQSWTADNTAMLSHHCSLVSTRVPLLLERTLAMKNNELNAYPEQTPQANRFANTSEDEDEFIDPEIIWLP